MTDANEHPLFSVPMPLFTDGGQKMALAVTGMQAQAFKAFFRYQIEALSFLKHRFEQDIMLAGDLADSADLKTTLDVVSKYMQTTTSEYAAEMSKLVALNSKIASETVRNTQKQTRTLFEDSNTAA